MILPSEVESRAVVPVLRAAVVTMLVRDHGFNQRRAADVLGITQPSVSNYLRMARGRMRDLAEHPTVKEVAVEIVKAIMGGEDRHSVMMRFNKGLQRIRRERILCIAHKTLEPVIDVDSCHICD